MEPLASCLRTHAFFNILDSQALPIRFWYFCKFGMHPLGLAIACDSCLSPVYLADRGKRVHVLNLNNETIFVNGNDVLAMEDAIEWEIKLMRRVAGMLAGGLFNVRLSGRGMIAITTHYAPLALQVTPDTPVFSDPNATVAWSGSLLPEIVTNFTLGTFLGRGSGEAIQLKFQGNGWVILQPYEEVYFQNGSSGQ